ncbi:MAG: hypothetical protein QW666_00340 [Candidatus Woesearchaeota archaeon]
MPKKEAKSDVRSAENTVRDLKNWIFTFAKEYNLPEEAIKKLHEQVDKVAVKIGEISCKPAPVIKEAENAVRDLKNWIFTFAKEYNLPEEAVNMLHTKVDEVAIKVGQVVCK